MLKLNLLSSRAEIDITRSTRYSVSRIIFQSTNINSFIAQKVLNSKSFIYTLYLFQRFFINFIDFHGFIDLFHRFLRASHLPERRGWHQPSDYFSSLKQIMAEINGATKIATSALIRPHPKSPKARKRIWAQFITLQLVFSFLLLGWYEICCGQSLGLNFSSIQVAVLRLNRVLWMHCPHCAAVCYAILGCRQCAWTDGFASKTIFNFRIGRNHESCDGCLLCGWLACYGPIEDPGPDAPINNTASHGVNLHKKVGLWFFPSLRCGQMNPAVEFII